jgi:thymidylate synthase
MTQRSADMFLGVPFNIASTALFMVLIGKLTGYHPRMLTLSFGDAHIYSEHIDACNIACARMPYPYCQLSVNKEMHDVHDLEQLQFADLQLHNYVCHPAIKATMKI